MATVIYNPPPRAGESQTGFEKPPGERFPFDLTAAKAAAEAKVLVQTNYQASSQAAEEERISREEDEEEEDEDEEVERDRGRSSSRGKKQKKSSAPILALAAVVVVLAAAVAIVFLRTREKAAEELRSRRVVKAPLIAETVPSAPANPTPPPEKLAIEGEEQGALATKPMRAGRPTREGVVDAKPGVGRPSQDDLRRASEAYQRGNTKFLQGNAAEAIPDFAEALRLNPKYSVAHRGLGLAYASVGNVAEALKHLKFYVKASPKASDAPIIQGRINQLSGK